MSSSETENSENDIKSKRKTKFAPNKLKEIKKWEQDDIFDYIEKLHGLLKRNEKKLQKYKEKMKKLLKKLATIEENAKEIVVRDNEAAAQSAEPAAQSAEPAVESANVPKSENTDETSASAAFSFVDEMREAAERAQNLNDFVYEPTSGLYYDQKTGYYYNAEYGLYYDGNTGCYYSYDRKKNAFEFHSQVQVQPNQTTAKATTKDDKDSFENYAVNAEGSNGDDDDANNIEVAFDEWGGVITDKLKLQQIKVDKEKLKAVKEKYKKKKQKSSESSKVKEKISKKRKRKTRTKRRSSSRSRSLSRERDDIEDGELSTSSSSSDSDYSDASHDSAAEGHTKQDVALFKAGSRFQDIAKKYPPSLRIIVQETNLDELKIGSLSLITFKGGSLGREGTHDVIIPDVNVSKYHLKFNYDSMQSVYKCIDLGSRNGTILNGARMSVAKTESTAYDVVHGSTIQIAQTKLLCHVHEGNSTCGLCEPGLLIAEATRETAADTVVLSHKEQLKKLQKKYGLENEKFVEAGKQNAGNYNDRAATRRIQIGSSSDKEKTQIASINTEISSDNKGFKMLAKLGWNKGESLGKTGGLLQPINVASNAGKKGLGCEDATAGITLTAVDKKKLDACKKMQERYQKTDIFSLSDESN